MHILILPSWYVSSYNALTGMFVKDQAEALKKYGYQVGVIAIQAVGIRNVIKEKKLDLSYRYFIENGVHTYRLQYPDIKLDSVIKKIKMAFFVRIFEKYIKDHGLPDIIHVHSFMAGEFAIYVKEKYNIPFVVTEHLSSFARNKVDRKDLDKAKKVFEKSDYNIAVSKHFSDLLQDKFSLEFSYIPNIVNIDFFNLKESAEKDTYDFITIAGLDKNKNYDVLVRAFSHAFKNKSKIKLTIVGDGKEYDNLKNLIRDLQMEDQISLYGWATREEVEILLQNSDAFVLSSEHETFGLVIVEAMACGLPVVATKCGGPESIIRKQDGILVPVNDVGALASGMVFMYTNFENYNPEEIRASCVERYSEKAVIQRLSHVYEEIVNAN